MQYDIDNLLFQFFSFLVDVGEFLVLKGVLV